MNIDVKVGRVYYWGHKDSLLQRFRVVSIDKDIAICEYIDDPGVRYQYRVEDISRGCNPIYTVEGFEV